MEVGRGQTTDSEGLPGGQGKQKEMMEEETGKVCPLIKKKKKSHPVSP